MKINEILIESQLQEGPMLDKFGRAVGGVASGVAKGVGAVAGGIAGMGSAFKKGFSAGKTTVAGDEAPAKPSMVGDLAKGLGKDAYKGATGYDVPGQDKASLKKKAAQGGAAPAATTAPAATGAAPAAPAAPAATGKAPAAKPAATPAAAAAPAAAPNPKADTAYAQAQKAVAGLAPKQKSQLVKMLQSDPKVAAAAKAPAAAPAKTPAGKMANAPVSKTNTAKPGNPNQAEIDADRAKIMGQPDKVDAGAGAMGAMAGQLAKGGAAEPNTMANAPVSKTNKAKPGNPNAAPEPGMTADGQPHYDPATGKGAKFDGVTGEMTPTWKAEQDKKAAEKQTKAAPAQQDKAPTPEPATPTTGQAATQAADAGGNPEKAALDAMKAKNPKLAGMMAQAGMDDQGNDVEPVKKPRGKKKPAAPSQATMDADRERMMGPTSDSIIRTRPMMAEGFSLFRKR
jgi:hypothetical protein